ncbi:unnamed protein product, partial [Ectocarpus sp. 12 AP-2014]
SDNADWIKRGHGSCTCSVGHGTGCGLTKRRCFRLAPGDSSWAKSRLSRSNIQNISPAHEDGRRRHRRRGGESHGRGSRGNQGRSGQRWQGRRGRG